MPVSAQPFALAINNVDGNPFTCNLLDDLGIYKRLRVQATQNASNATWEFPALCSFPGNVWRPYTAGTLPIPFNTTIPPVPNTAAALYNSGNGGASGNLSPVTLGNYYTFNVQNIFTPTGSPFIGVLETATFPVSIPNVTQNPVSNAVGENVPVTVSITTSAAPVENVFVRYTTDNFVSTRIVQATFTGNNGTADIPGFPLGTAVKYYVYSSPKSKTLIDSEATLFGEIVHDMSTLDWNTNISQNYSYVVTTVLPVNLLAFNGTKQQDANIITWKADCTSGTFIQVTLEKRHENNDYKPIFQANIQAQNCSLPFSYSDVKAETGANYYRLKYLDERGRILYSRVIILLNKTDGIILTKIAPNPITDNSTLELVSAKAQNIMLMIVDQKGAIVIQKNYRLVSGLNRIPIDGKSLSGGLYIMKAIAADGNVAVLKIMKP
jgi:hypothetical protein